MKALFLVLSVVVPLNGGCLIEKVINYTTTSTLYLREKTAPAKENKSDDPRETIFNETVGEYLDFIVREETNGGQICKKYRIQVEKLERDMGNIRLLRSNSCDKDGNFDVFMSEFPNVPIKRCIINISVYDSNRVTLEIFDESAKEEKAMVNVPVQKPISFFW